MQSASIEPRATMRGGPTPTRDRSQLLLLASAIKKLTFVRNSSCAKQLGFAGGVLYYPLRRVPP